MMNNPPLNELQNKVGTRYMLVTVVARRARQLIQMPDKIGNRKPVSVAIEELYDDKLKIDYPEEYNK